MDALVSHTETNLNELCFWFLSCDLDKLTQAY